MNVLVLNIPVNVEGVRCNLEDWIFHQVNPYEGMQVLGLPPGRIMTLELQGITDNPRV